MGDDEPATLDGQFVEFALFLTVKKKDVVVPLMTLYCSDYWMRQANIIDDRKVTMTDTGLCFNKYSKTELNFDEWLEYLSDLCFKVGLDEEKTQDALTNCGLPGQVPVSVPAYRDFFRTYKPKEKMQL